MNGDGVIDSFDVSPFVMALLPPADYETTYSGLFADISRDTGGSGDLDFFDIKRFVDLLLNRD